MSNKRERKSFIRKQGNRKAVGPKKRSVTFSWEKLDITQGQTVKEWEASTFLSVLCERMRQIGGYTTEQVLANQMIKQYTKVGFPPDSDFKEPQHVSPAYWGVIHITPKSKEVVAGYLEEDVFYIIFLNQEHKFWPTSLQSRGKNKR